MAGIAIATGTMMLDERGAGGSGGNATSTGAVSLPFGHK